MKTAKSKRCYFDLADMIKANATGYFPYTPALPMLYGLRESLNIIEEEGLENIFFRHHYLAEGVRAAVTEGWKLKLCAVAPKWYSDTVSAIMVPEGINGAEVIARAFTRYNLALGAGLSKVAGKLFRIGHLGDLNELMLLGGIAGAEMAMLDVGAKLEPGSGGSLRVRLTGQGDPRKAYAAIKAAKDRGWESYRAIERFISNGQQCRRRQILDHFGDHEEGRPEGRCCDVCEPDAELVAAVARALEKPQARKRGARGGAQGAHEAELLEPVDESQWEVLKAWRLARSEGKPAYTVATNAALEEALRRRPASLDELLQVRGIGPAFCEKHGESLLRALAELGGEAPGQAVGAASIEGAG